jgi:protein O-mannosyl-transferase
MSSGKNKKKKKTAGGKAVGANSGVKELRFAAAGNKKKSLPQNGPRDSAPPRRASRPAPDTPDLPGGKLPVWTAFLIVVLVAALPYLNTFGNQFTSYDDEAHILNNQFIRSLDWENVKRMLSSYNPGVVPVVDYPLTHISFAINYHFSGYNPWGYHFTNLLLYVLSCVLLLILLRAGPWGKGIALWAAVIFAAHPLHVEAVTWLISRKDVLSVTLALASIAVYVLFVRGRGVRAWMAWAGALFLWSASMYAKPGTASVPLLIALWVGFCEPRERWPRGLTWLAPWFAAAFFFSWALVLESAHRHFVGGYLGGGMASELFTKGYVILRYIQLLIAPVNLSAYYLVRAPKGWYDALYLSSWAGLGALAVLFALFARRRPFVWFYPTWFIAALLPVLHFVPFQIRMAERYLYLPSVAFCLAVAAGAARLNEILEKKNKKAGPATVVALACLALLYAAGSFSRNPVWRNSYTLWSDTVKKCPDCSFVLNNLGVEYDRMNKTEEAEKLYLRSIEADPENFQAFANLGAISSQRRDYVQARKYFETARKLKPTDPGVTRELAAMYVATKKPGGAVPLLRLVLNSFPDDLKARRLMCLAGSDLKFYGEAIASCEYYLGKNSEDMDVRWIYASDLYATRRLDKAAKIYADFTENNPSFDPAWVNLGLTLYQKGKKQEAVAAWETALKINPRNEKARKFLEAASGSAIIR